MNLHIPGAGVTPFNVWDLQFRFWRRYRDIAEQIMNAQAKEAKQRGR